MKDISHLLVLNCAMVSTTKECAFTNRPNVQVCYIDNTRFSRRCKLQVFVQALASTVVSVQPLADPVWGPSLPTDRLLGGLRTPCHRKCDYGYDTDIEGNLICKCKNPCRVSKLLFSYPGMTLFKENDFIFFNG